MRICPYCNKELEALHCPDCHAPTIDPSTLEGGATDRYVGATIAERYSVGELIGKGGMGRVYRGVQLSVDREVAIKVLKEDMATSMEQIKRFHREARATSKLTHPNSLRVIDFGQTGDGDLYLVMELLHGKTLKAILAEEGRLPWPRALRIVIQVCKSLEEAHSHGIVHRDLKPDNIFLEHIFGERDFVKVVDFGIAKLVGDEGEGSTITQTGVTVGTPTYMSPEQSQVRPLDARSDLYSLGVILYELLTGSVPFRGRSTIETLMLHIREDPPPLRPEELAATLPTALRQLVFAMLAKDPGARPQSAFQVIERAEAVLAAGGEPLKDITGSSPGVIAAPSSSSSHEGSSPTPVGPRLGDDQTATVGARPLPTPPGSEAPIEIGARRPPDAAPHPLDEEPRALDAALPAPSSRVSRGVIVVGSIAALVVIALGLWWLLGGGLTGGAISAAGAPGLGPLPSSTWSAGSPAPTPPSPAPATEATAEAAALELALAKATEAYKEGRYELASSLCEQVLAVDEGNGPASALLMAAKASLASSQGGASPSAPTEEQGLHDAAPGVAEAKQDQAAGTGTSAADGATDTGKTSAKKDKGKKGKGKKDKGKKDKGKKDKGKKDKHGKTKKDEGSGTDGLDTTTTVAPVNVEEL